MYFSFLLHITTLVSGEGFWLTTLTMIDTWLEGVVFVVDHEQLESSCLEPLFQFPENRMTIYTLTAGEFSSI